jgi:hypothetical protein
MGKVHKGTKARKWYICTGMFKSNVYAYKTGPIEILLRYNRGTIINLP